MRLTAAAAVSVVLLAILWGQLPGIAAGGLLHPARRVTSQPPPANCVDAQFAGAGVTLRGWTCASTSPRRGAIVYLHGIADNRGSAAGIVQRFVPRGFDVIAYDSRAHGDSEGDACTYGFFEKQDLRRVLDTLPAGPVVLIGTSLGAAVALQETADDPRVTAVVAAETFSDLRTVATERAPSFLTKATINRAFALVETQAGFRVDDVHPQNAARRITAPVLIIHGEQDSETPPAHSQRVYAALSGPKRLLLVRGAGHNSSLSADVWDQIDRWIDDVIPKSRQ